MNKALSHPSVGEEYQLQMRSVHSFHRQQGTDEFTIELLETLPAIGGRPFGYRVSARIGDRQLYTQELFFDWTLFGPFWRANRFLTGCFKKLGLPEHHPLLVDLIRILSPFYQHETSRYEFNEHGVCLNAEKIRIEDAKRSLVFKLAQAPNQKWGITYDYEEQNMGEGRPLTCSLFSNDFLYASRQQALVSLICQLRERFKSIPTLMDKLQSLHGKTQQLSLF